MDASKKEGTERESDVLLFAVLSSGVTNTAHSVPECGFEGLK